MVTASTGTTLWNYTALDSAVDGLSQTRSPMGLIGGWFRGTPVSFALSFSTYAERTWDLVTEDTVTIRGESIASTRRLKSNGGIVDLRAALAYRLSSRLSLGAAFHMLGGSSSLTTRRNFSSVDYISYVESNRVAFSGLGVSAGLVATLDPRLTFALAVRSDDRLEIEVDSAPAGSFDLPWSFVGGMFIVPVPALRFSSTVVRQTWSDMAGIGAANAFDTWDVSAGVELGGTQGTTKLPLSLGFRYAQLPFSPTTEQPREINFTGGSTLLMAADRVMFDFSVERILRRGGGAEEWAWFLSAALTIRP
jgi:hypothetical protein